MFTLIFIYHILVFIYEGQNKQEMCSVDCCAYTFKFILFESKLEQVFKLQYTIDMKR